MLPILAIAFGPLASAGSCPEPRTVAALHARIQLAEEGYARLDADTFEHTASDLPAIVACLREPVAPSTAAEVHRVLGLLAYLREDTSAAARSFAAARAADPDYRFPPTLVPSGYPELVLYEAVDVAVGMAHRSPVPRAFNATVNVDGRDAQERSAEWPALIQVVASDGSITWSGIVEPGASLPPYDVPAPASPPERSRNAPLAVSAATALVMGGTTLFLANDAAQEYRDLDTAYEDLAGLRTRANAYTGATAGSAVVAATLGVAWVARW